MATTKEVLEMLLPDGGWIITGDDFDSIVWVDDRPRCTKAEFIAGFAEFDDWKAQQDAQATADKAKTIAKLVALGLTEDEAKAMIG